MSTTTKKTLISPKGVTGDRNLAQLWLYKVDAYFKVNATIYGDDASKIYFILRLCEESKAVQKWAEGEYSSWANMRAQDTRVLATHATAVAMATMTVPFTGQAPTPSEWLTFDAFLERFKARWISSNNGMEAIIKIAKMKQTGSVADYNSVLVTVAYNTSLNDTAPLL
jgi:hypothetical protein